jgi:hypothetical protein
LRAPTAPSPEPRTQEEEEEEDGGNVDLDSRRQGKAVVLKTTTRQTIFLPVIGLVDGGKFLVHALHLLFFSSSRLRPPQGSATVSLRPSLTRSLSVLCTRFFDN